MISALSRPALVRDEPRGPTIDTRLALSIIGAGRQMEAELNVRRTGEHVLLYRTGHMTTRRFADHEMHVLAIRASRSGFPK